MYNYENLGMLKVENEEKILRGNYVADLIFIDGGSLTVYGSMSVKYYISVNNGQLIISGRLDNAGDLISLNADISAEFLKTVNIKAEVGTLYCARILDCVGINATKTNITAKRLRCKDKIEMVDGNVEVSKLESRSIYSNADIIVHESTKVDNVHCFNYLIDGVNNSGYIEAMKIHILGESKSYWLKAKEIILGSDADLCGCEIKATSYFKTGGHVRNCSKWNIPK